METRVVFLILGSIVSLFVVGCMSADKRPVPMTGQHPQSFEKEIKITAHLDYLLYLPEQYTDSKENWPLLLFLHGAGERGDNLEELKKNGPPMLIAKKKKQFPFVVVSPQCPQGGWWSNETQLQTLNALLDELIRRYRIDEERIYLTGLSMGGHGTWALATEYPHRFAAIAPICGSGNPDKAARISHLPTWVFHGAKDRTVPLKGSREMVEALKKAGGDVEFTIYPEAGHNSWTKTYNNPQLYEWLLKHKRSAGK